MIELLHKYRIDHLAFGLLIVVVITPLALFVTGNLKSALWLAWFAQSNYWLGREIRDTEIKLKAVLPREWFLAWNLTLWPHDCRLDFVIPVIGIAVITLLVTGFL